MKILQGGDSGGWDIFFLGEGAHYNREGAYFLEEDAYFYGKDACLSDVDVPRHGAKLRLQIADSHFHVAVSYLHGEDQFPPRSFFAMRKNYMFARRRGGPYRPPYEPLVTSLLLDIGQVEKTRDKFCKWVNLQFTPKTTYCRLTRNNSEETLKIEPVCVDLEPQWLAVVVDVVSLFHRSESSMVVG